MPAPAKKLAPQKSVGANGRRYTRFAIDARMQVRMFQSGEFQSCSRRTTALGQHGIGATHNGQLQTGEIVSLEIPLPLSPHPLKVRAIVRYCDGLRYGFEFLTLNAAQREMLRRVCEVLASKS